jgi:hypothetical protein
VCGVPIHHQHDVAPDILDECGKEDALFVETGGGDRMI